MKHSFSILLIAICGLFLLGCSKEDDADKSDSVIHVDGKVGPEHGDNGDGSDNGSSSENNEPAIEGPLSFSSACDLLLGKWQSIEYTYYYFSGRVGRQTYTKTSDEFEFTFNGNSIIGDAKDGYFNHSLDEMSSAYNDYAIFFFQGTYDIAGYYNIYIYIITENRVKVVVDKHPGDGLNSTMTTVYKRVKS